MTVSNYLSKYVKIDINSGYYYEGKVIDVGEDFLELIDKNGDRVTISLKNILLIKEVSA